MSWLPDPSGSGYGGSHFELQFRGWGYNLGHTIGVGGFICIWLLVLDACFLFFDSAPLYL